MALPLTIAITLPDGSVVNLGTSDAAQEAIRFSFNPSNRQDVVVLKALAAAFLTQIEAVERDKPEAGYELATAKAFAQTASMWAVLGATKGVP
jgi:hypothetical protein